MKLSQNTIAVLKNFAGINNGIVIQQGKTLKTMSVLRNCFAQAEIDEELPASAFYNLSELLSVISLFKDPELEFDEKFVTIGTGRSKVRYFYSDPTVIVAPTKDIKAPSMDISFTIDADSLAELIKAASVLQLPDIVVESDGEKMTISAKDLKNPSTNAFSQEIETVGDGGDLKFMMVFRLDLLQKLRAGNFDVELSSKLISRWTSVEHKTTYYLSMEQTSKML